MHTGNDCVLQRARLQPLDALFIAHREGMHEIVNRHERASHARKAQLAGLHDGLQNGGSIVRTHVRHIVRKQIAHDAVNLGGLVGTYQLGIGAVGRQ